MARTVLILGAGASVEAGVPLMKDFLDEAEILYRNKNSPIDLEKFENVFKVLSGMQLIQSKASFDLVNIESVFAAIEIGKLLGVKFNDDVDPQITRNSIIYLIFRTIELKTKIFRYRDHLEINPPYKNFNKFVKNYLEEEGPDALAIITFNYDILLDLSLHIIGMDVDYSLPSYKTNPSVPLLKLHGSINWGECTKCRQVIPWPIDEYIKFKGLNTEYKENPGPILITPGNEISIRDCPSCKGKLDSTPFIIPPTWNKTQFHSQIDKVWQGAARHLKEAENILIIGYSLPDTDYFFHYLYAVGTMGMSRLKNIWVCNPDPQVDQRFRMILGEQAQQRYRFFEERFDISLSYVRGLLSK